MKIDIVTYYLTMQGNTNEHGDSVDNRPYSSHLPKRSIRGKVFKFYPRDPSEVKLSFSYPRDPSEVKHSFVLSKSSIKAFIFTQEIHLRESFHFKPRDPSEVKLSFFTQEVHLK